MAMMSRVGTALLLAGGMALSGLMLFTLVADVWPGPGRLAEAADVAVIVPDRNDWLDFRQGINACAGRGLVRIVRDDADTVTVATPERRVPIRFAWKRALGSVETRQEVRSLLSGPNRPAAVVGSINTALTADLAGALREAAGPGTGGPVLLIPWATSTEAADPDRRAGEVPLLDIYPRRSFRFCPNNEREAELVVGCLSEIDPRPPALILVMTDPADSYSVDLADGFKKAIRGAVRAPQMIESDEAVRRSVMAETPGLVELQWAERVWQIARGAPTGQATWVVLPLQGEPTRLLLSALRGMAPGVEAPPLHVLCGDGIGPDSLRRFVGTLPFGVWCASGDSIPEGDHGVPRGAQVPAEIVSAIARSLDGPSSPEGLRDALAALDLPADDPNALGRSLAFDPSGERRGDDLGHVVAALPDRDDVVALGQDADGAWSAPIPIPPTTAAARP